MTGAVNKIDNILSTHTTSASSMCDGGFKSMAYSNKFPINGSESLGCTLIAAKQIVQVFVQALHRSRD